MGEAGRRKTYQERKEEERVREKEKEDKAFRTFESYVRTIVEYGISRSEENESRLILMRDKMRKLIKNGEANDSDDGK